MEALVVGAGYVGSVLARRLADDGHTVHAVTRTGVDLDGVVDLRLDVTQPPLELPDAEVTFYLVGAGGRTRARTRRAHLDGVRNVRDATDAPLVKASSTSVYGHRGGDWVDAGTPPSPMNARHRLILAGERVVRDAGGTVVRFAGLYGPGRRLLDRYLDGATVEAGYTNLAFRDDAADAMVAAWQGDGDLYVAVDDEPADRHELARWLAERTGRPPGELVDTERVPNKRCRNDRLRDAGWRPVFRSFREGLDPLLKASEGPSRKV